MRSELQKAYIKGEAGTDLCVGGCDPWEATEAGHERYAELKKRYEEQKR